MVVSSEGLRCSPRPVVIERRPLLTMHDLSSSYPVSREVGTCIQERRNRWFVWCLEVEVDGLTKAALVT
jgi:hypothetical protein